MGPRLSSWLLPVLCCAAATLCHAQNPQQETHLAGDADPAQAKKWPLRLHVLAIDDTHRTVRLQPNWASGALPDPSGDVSGPSPERGSASLGGGEDDFSGAGRADLVTPPGGTAGIDFTYEGCSRVRIAPGFSGLPARWIKPGARLEVILPTDAATEGRMPTGRCTLKVVPQEFVYLRLPNGAILRVTPEAFAKKPSLRMFLSGGGESLQRRAPKTADATPNS